MTEIKVTSLSLFGILFLFFMFWAQSGWYRVDCAVGVQKACGLIDAEYEKKARP